MKLKDLAKKPTLVKVVLDDAEVIETYGEPIEFFTYDRQPMTTYLKMASIDPEDTGAIFETMRELVLDEDGKEILNDDNGIPSPILMKVLNYIIENLGK